MVKDVKDHKSARCYCSHCRDYPVQIFGSENGGGQLTKNAESYLLRGIVKDITLNKHPARLSVRWVRSGSYTYEIEGRNYILQPGKFLVINDGQTYTLYS